MSTKIPLPKLRKLDLRFKLWKEFSHRLEFSGWPYTSQCRMYHDMCSDLTKQFGFGVEAPVIQKIDLAEKPEWAFEFNAQGWPAIYLRDKTLTHWHLTKPRWEQWNDPMDR